MKMTSFTPCALINKMVLFLRSILCFVFFKIKYGRRISISLIYSLRNAIRIQLKEKSQLKVGKFLMADGPLYIKAEGIGNIVIGDNVFFNHNCSITSVENVVIGNNCNIANNVVIVDHDHRIGKLGVENGLVSASIEIKDNVWIGANSTILRGVTIGKNSVIAAGAVVNTDIPEGEIWGGVPAKKIRTL